MNINRYTRTYVFAFLTISTAVLSFAQVRSYDGFGNNVANPQWGAAGSPLKTVIPLAYSDGISAPNGVDRPNPRTISNDLFSQLEAIYDGHNLTDYTTVFAQFIEHEVSLIEESEETISIPVPPCDPVFDPTCTGRSEIRMLRSRPLEGSGTGVSNPRQFANEISAYIDGSAVYGSNPERAAWLRTFSNGKLKTSFGNLLPFNTLDAQLNGPTDPNAPPMKTAGSQLRRYFVAGDIRANENIMLIALHTLFVREHNRICDELKVKYPGMTDEDLYQRARKMVAGFIQNIVYSEWLPSIGIVLEDYKGYRPDINVNVSNIFSAAAFRFDHTLMSSNILRMDDECEAFPQGDIEMRDAFYNPELIITSGIDPVVKGMSAQIQQNLDCKVIDELRNYVTGLGRGFDVVAVNINRGRERGLPDYNSVREILGLSRVRSFGEITSDPADARILEDLYGSVDRIDPWVGMLAEKHIPGAMFGETIMVILQDQFRTLRDGDRFFFENDPELSAADKAEIRHTTLAYLITRNTNLQAMQENVFFMERTCHKIEIEEKHLAITVAPNPIQEDFNLHIYAFERGDAQVIVSDIMGREIMRIPVFLDRGINSFNLNLASGMPIGFYNLEVHQGLRFNAQKILKAK
jgi:peroxidase